MRHSLPRHMLMISLSLLALGACTPRPEVKTGSLTQRFTLIDSDGRIFGRVEMDPVAGGSIIDVQGRLVGRIIPPSATTPSASPVALAPITGTAAQ